MGMSVFIWLRINVDIGDFGFFTFDFTSGST